MWRRTASRDELGAGSRLSLSLLALAFPQLYRALQTVESVERMRGDPLRFPFNWFVCADGFFYLLLREPVRSPVRFRAFVDTLEGFPARQGLFCSARAVVCECEILWVLCLCVRGGKSIICIGSGAASGSSAEKLKPNGGGTRTLRATVKVGKILGRSCSCIVGSQRGQPRKIDRLRQN